MKHQLLNHDPQNWTRLEDILDRHLPRLRATQRIKTAERNIEAYKNRDQEEYRQRAAGIVQITLCLPGGAIS